ncbi:MAG: hypothetical protein GY838_08575 [bacterium]|nr:hypothetical protein [bacterium]
MSRIRSILIILVLLASSLALVACQGGGSDTFEWQPIYGDGGQDGTEVLARVGDLEITQKDLDLRYDELPTQARSRYDGEEGQRLLLQEMTNETLLVLGAVEQELFNTREVQRTLITTRRTTLERAMRGLHIVGDKQPSDEEVKEFFNLNRADYQVMGRVNLRHIECLTREDAEAAYERLQSTAWEDNFAHVSNDFNVNKQTRENEGILGWVNKGSYVPFIPDSVEFTTKAYDLPMGINPPISVGDRWHVVQVETREEDRSMTFQEARDTAREHMRAGWQDQLGAVWLDEARVRTGVTFHGRFAPGGGLTVDQIFARAMLVPDHKQKYDLFLMITKEFPDSDRADDAYYWGAQAAMDAWQDRVMAVGLLSELVQKYPDSEFIEDARYIVDNAYDEAVWNPPVPGGGE